jgi:hypothetical protein
MKSGTAFACALATVAAAFAVAAVADGQTAAPAARAIEVTAGDHTTPAGSERARGTRCRSGTRFGL